MMNQQHFRKNMVWALLIILSIPAAAFAHAFLDHADPRVGSEIDKSPKEVRIWFTEAVEPAFSVIQVFDANGNEVDGKNTHLDAKDNTLLIVSLPPLGSGDYKVVWRVIASDTHKTHGDFKFTVKKT